MSPYPYPGDTPGKRKVKRWNQNAYSGLPRLSDRGPDGRAISRTLSAQGGAIGLGKSTDRGQKVFEALRRIRTHRPRDKGGASVSRSTSSGTRYS
jgi:hypothetical protein